MKKYFTYLFVSLLIVTNLFITSCKSEVKKDNNTKEETGETYKCPMDCENGKVYTKAGTCPVCEMDLEKTSTI